MLNVRMSVADILLVKMLIDKYMEENNVKDINEVSEIEIQEKYDKLTLDLDNFHRIDLICGTIINPEFEIPLK